MGDWIPEDAAEREVAREAGRWLDRNIPEYIYGRNIFSRVGAYAAGRAGRHIARFANDFFKDENLRGLKMPPKPRWSKYGRKYPLGRTIRRPAAPQARSTVGISGRIRAGGARLYKRRKIYRKRIFGRRRSYPKRVYRRPIGFARRFGARRIRGLKRLRSYKSRAFNGRVKQFPKRIRDGIRKTIGQCYNQIVQRELGWVYGGASFQTDSNPRVFGFASSAWYNDRRDLLNQMNALLTDAQVANNVHMYPQHDVIKQTIRNQTSVALRMQIFCFKLRCNSANAGSAYASPTTTTQVGPSYTDSRFADAVNQDARLRPQAADSIVSQFGLFDPILNTNDGITVLPTVPQVFQNNPWNLMDFATDQQRLAMKAPLSWIFPEMRRLWKITKVFDKTIPGLGQASWSMKLTHKPEYQPRIITDGDEPTVTAGVGCVFFVRAYHTQTNFFDSGATSATTVKVVEPQVVYSIDTLRKTGWRIAGDSEPHYICQPTPSISKWTASAISSLSGATNLTSQYSRPIVHTTHVANGLYTT